MSRTPSPSGHVIVIADEPGPGGWAVTCWPHGDLGCAPTRTAAFLAAVEHDEQHGGDTGR